MKKSAGLPMYCRIEGELGVFLVHPGGPFWTRKDRGGAAVILFDQISQGLAISLRFGLAPSTLLTVLIQS